MTNRHPLLDPADWQPLQTSILATVLRDCGIDVVAFDAGTPCRRVALTHLDPAKETREEPRSSTGYLTRATSR
jgi:hypothetical protein